MKEMADSVKLRVLRMWYGYMDKLDMERMTGSV